MKKIAWKLLEKILYNSNTIFTLDQLSNTYNVTKRSIRNYITSINEQYPNLISITKEKVYINNPATQPIEIPNFEESRQSILFKELIKKQRVDYFAFAEKEFIEIPTIEKDLLYLRSFFKPYAIELKKDGSYIYLIGKEHQIRKATSNLIKSELNKDLYTLNTLSSSYPNINVIELDEALTTISEKHNFKVNVFARYDILLHICILISRANIVEEINHVDDNKHLKSISISAFIDDLVNTIYNLQNIILNEREKKYLSFLFASRITKVHLVNDSLNEEYLNESISNTIIKVLQRATNQFYLELDDHTFINRLNLHIQSLIDRIRKQQIIRNPFTQNLKNQFPLVYEVAVFIACELQKELEIDILEDEISFFALHIGSLIMQNNANKKRLSCLLVCPDYNNIQKEFKNNFHSIFAQELNISMVVEEITSDIELSTFDIVVSTIPILYFDPIVIVSPFLDKNDLRAIENKIDTIKEMNKRKDIKASFVQILNRKFYNSEIYYNDKSEYIDHMYRQLEKEQIVNIDFLTSTLERENMSSTAFNNMIAIPHALKMSAKKTTISIINNKKPIQWGENSVFIIILFALSKEDMEQFYEIFDSIIGLFSKIEDIEILTNAKDYDDFINKMISLLK